MKFFNPPGRDPRPQDSGAALREDVETNPPATGLHAATYRNTDVMKRFNLLSLCNTVVTRERWKSWPSSVLSLSFFLSLSFSLLLSDTHTHTKLNSKRRLVQTVFSKLLSLSQSRALGESFMTGMFIYLSCNDFDTCSPLHYTEVTVL